MKSIIKDIQQQNPMMEKSESAVKTGSLKKTGTSRRDFIRKGAIGGIAIGGLMRLSVEDTIAQTTSKVNRASSPSDLKITDMRVAVVGNVGRTAIIRIDTNQGIYGLGEVPDAHDIRTA